MNYILIDYLVVSFKFDAMPLLYQLLNLYGIEFEDIRSFYGYQFCMYYSGIKLHWNSDEYGTITEVILDLSGKGCRAIEEINDHIFDWFELLHTFDSNFLDRTANIARIDIAYDDLSCVLDLAQIKRYTRNQQYICRSKSLPLIMEMREEAVYFGSSASDRRLRIYDKKLEQGNKDENLNQWLRLEFQLRNDNAMSFYLNWFIFQDIGRLYKGMMMDYLRFVQVPKGKSIEDFKRNEHLDRLDTAVWWNKFLDSAERITQLYLPGEEYTFERLEHYIKKQTNSSVKTYLHAIGGDFGKYIESVQNTQLNAKQRDLISRIENKNTQNTLQK